MNREKTILFLLFFFVTAICLAVMGESVHSRHEILFYAEQSEQQSSIFSEKRPQVFAIQRQGQSAVNYLRNSPVTNAKTNHQEARNSCLYSDLPVRRAVTISLFISRYSDHGLSVRELIFPFHYFF